MDPKPPPWKLAVIVVVAAAIAAAGIWWFARNGYSIRKSVDEGILVLRQAGPVAFFGAMSVLPAIGFPVMPFHLTAASAFAAQLGMSGVIAAAGFAMAANISINYWVARQALRPWIEELVSRTRYRIPRIDSSEHGELTLLVRITPGPPFFIQGCLLGLAGVRFWTYLWISWVISMAYACGFIIFGDAILHGKGRAAALGLSAIIAVVLIVHFIRRHLSRKKAGARDA